MFEKEAKEWVEKNLHSTEEDYIKAFIDGAEFGYNKANEWHYVKDELPHCDWLRRFEADSLGVHNLAYLVSEPEEKKLKWTDLKIGDVIRKKNGCIEGMVICIHKDINDRDRRIFCGVRLSDEELEEWEKVE